MPQSGKLQTRTYINRAALPLVEYGPYPRSGWSWWIRTILLFFWVIIGWYLTNAATNIYQLDHANLLNIGPQLSDCPHLFDITRQLRPDQPSCKDIFDAFFLPGALSNRSTPLWVFLFSIILFVSILVGSIWATRDKLREDEIKQNEAIHEELDKDLQVRGMDKKLARPHRSPYDIDRIDQIAEIRGKFVGRKRDLQWIMQRLRSKKETITIICGPPGIGKTALVAEVLHQLYSKGAFRDGVAVARCRGKTSVVEIVQEVLSRFDPLRRLPETKDLNKLRDFARQRLDGKNALIVLDNVEPDLDISSVVSTLSSARGIMFLLTARQEVIPYQDKCQRLGPLSSPEAFDLFEQTWRRGAQSVPLDYRAVQRIVNKLDLHTLAIKLVAAHAASSQRLLSNIADEIEGNLQRAIFLPDDTETPEAMIRAFGTSIDALPLESQRLFIALAAFPSIEFGRKAALVLTKALNPARNTMLLEDSVDRLVRRALLEVPANKRMLPGSDNERRRLHPLLREFSRHMFEQWSQQEQATARQTVAKHYVTYVAAVEEEALVHDEANITGVLKWAYEQEMHEFVIQLCAGMQFFWLRQWRTDISSLYLPRGVEAAKTIAQRTNNVADYEKAATLALSCGQVLHQIGELKKAQEQCEYALNTFQMIQNQQGEAETFASLGVIEQQRGKLKDAEDHYSQSLQIFHTTENLQGEAEILTSLGEIAQQQGRLRDAERFYRQSQGMLQDRKCQDCRGSQIHNLVHLGEIAYKLGRRRDAEKNYIDALVITRDDRTRNLQAESWVLGHLGNLMEAVGQIDVARKNYSDALEIVKKVQHRRGECWLLGQLGCLIEKSESLDSAKSHYEEALKIARDIEERREQGKICEYLGRIAEKQSNMQVAITYYEESLAIAIEVGDVANRADAAFALATLLQQMDTNRACMMIEEAIRFYNFMSLMEEERKARQLQKRLGCGS